MTLKGAAKSFLFGLFGTRQQITYALVGAYIYILLRAVSVAQTTSDHVALLNAAWPAVAIALGAWLGDKVREDRQNGHGAPPQGLASSPATPPGSSKP